MAVGDESGVKVWDIPCFILHENYVFLLRDEDPLPPSGQPTHPVPPPPPRWLGIMNCPRNQASVAQSNVPGGTILDGAPAAEEHVLVDQSPVDLEYELVDQMVEERPLVFEGLVEEAPLVAEVAVPAEMVEEQSLIVQSSVPEVGFPAGQWSRLEDYLVEVAGGDSVPELQLWFPQFGEF